MLGNGSECFTVEAVLLISCGSICCFLSKGGDFLLVGNITTQAKGPCAIGALVADGIDSYPVSLVDAGR